MCRNPCVFTGVWSHSDVTFRSPCFLLQRLKQQQREINVLLYRSTQMKVRYTSPSMIVPKYQVLIRTSHLFQSTREIKSATDIF